MEDQPQDMQPQTDQTLPEETSTEPVAETPAPVPAAPTSPTSETDIFAWAGFAAGLRDVLEPDLFVFNKKFTVYTANFSRDLTMRMKELFLFDLLNYVIEGPDQGMVVRTFEEAEGEELVIQRTQVGNVENAAYVIQQIEEPEEELEMFRDDEHDFKRIKGIVARFSHPSLGKPFYITKLIQQSSVMKAKVGIILDASTLKPLEADAALKIAPENQVMITGDDIFVFHQRKFETLFGYNAKQQFIAKQKIAEIESKFKLSFPEGMDLNGMIKDKKSAIKKLQKLEVGKVKQEELLDHADEMGVEMLVDDGGAIIIMDGKDLDKFINLLNDDYVESGLTGVKYEIRGKRVLGE